MKKIETGGIKGNVGERTKVITWKGGYRTVTRSKIYADKNGEIHRITKSNSFNVGGIGKLLILLMLSAALFGFFYDKPVPTFESFLNMLQNVPEFMSLERLTALFTIDIEGAPLPEFIKDLAQIGRGLVAVITVVITSAIDSMRFISYVFLWLLGM